MNIYDKKQWIIIFSYMKLTFQYLQFIYILLNNEYHLKWTYINKIFIWIKYYLTFEFSIKN